MVSQEDSVSRREERFTPHKAGLEYQIQVSARVRLEADHEGVQASAS